ncbi:unnamed protein product [Moneuplotes crassus]|uniref:Uncharacterized protein n=1 Tax=Euplotes crassus TaxID=5936 RepID=A0AAD1X6J6_EUPCR|nr:unnamed protein product [Moneuplotes crassus]
MEEPNIFYQNKRIFKIPTLNLSEINSGVPDIVSQKEYTSLDKKSPTFTPLYDNSDSLLPYLSPSGATVKAKKKILQKVIKSNMRTFKENKQTKARPISIININLNQNIFEGSKNQSDSQRFVNSSQFEYTPRRHPGKENTSGLYDSAHKPFTKITRLSSKFKRDRSNPLVNSDQDFSLDKNQTLNKPRYHALIDKDALGPRQKIARSPKINTERILKKNEINDLNKTDIYSIPYEFWEKKRFLSNCSESKDSHTTGGGKVTIGQTSKELMKQNNILQQKNEDLKLTVKKLRTHNAYLKSNYGKLNKTKIELNHRLEKLQIDYDKVSKQLAGKKAEFDKKMNKKQKEFDLTISQVMQQMEEEIQSRRKAELQLKELHHEVSLGVSKDTKISMDFVKKLLELRCDSNDKKVLNKLVKLAQGKGKSKNRINTLEELDPIIGNDISVCITPIYAKGKNKLRRFREKNRNDRSLSSLLGESKSWKGFKCAKPTESSIKRMKKSTSSRKLKKNRRIMNRRNSQK